MTHTPAPPDRLAADLASEPVHPHYAAPPPSREIAGEPRLLHAMMVAAWLGRLIDPLIHHDQDGHNGHAKKRLEERELGG